jgi:ribosomal protein S18 acetylase RimI-like enzyme
MKHLQSTSATIRPAEPDDVQALSVFAKTTYAEAFGHSMTAAELAWQLCHTRSESYFREQLGNDAILLAVAGSRIVGYVQIGDVTPPIRPASDSDQQLNALYVGRAQQGQGIGRRLMDAALALPRIRSAANLYLDVWRENRRALRFYAAYGFEVVGDCNVVVDSKIIGSDLIMRRPIA